MQLNYTIINNDHALREICQQASTKTFIALDTEFRRRSTFYPQLGLIQLFDGQKISLIDPLLIQDFSPFIELLANPQVNKVLHACSEDLEVFQHYFNQLPSPMWDTQVMAQFIGLGNSVGLATLLEKYFNLKVNKETALTNWLLRPLTDQQLNYAASDVAFLEDLYLQLHQELAKTPWEEAVQEECIDLLAKVSQGKDPEKLYKHMPQVHKLKGIQLYRLQKLTAWRYLEAQKRDLPPNYVVKSANLVAVAKKGAKNNFELLNLGINKHEVRIHGKKILRILAECEDSYAPESFDLYLHQHSQYKSLTIQLNHLVTENIPANLPLELFASRKLCDQFLNWYLIHNQNPHKLPKLLKGWRKPMGEKILREFGGLVIHN